MSHQHTANPIRSRRGIGRLTVASLALAFVGMGAAHPAKAGMWEFSDCRTPTELIFKSRTTTTPFQRLVRYPGSNNFEVRYKNPEDMASHDPLHAQNCTAGGGYPNKTQWITFKLHANNYFYTPAESHIAFLMRARFSNYNVSGGESYDGRGMIMFRTFPQGKEGDGVKGERFALRSIYGAPYSTVEERGPMQNFLFNDTPYQVVMHAAQNGVAYQVTNLLTGVTTGWRYWGGGTGMRPNDAITPDSGLGFAVLCPNGCDQSSNPYAPFTIRIWDISTNWF